MDRVERLPASNSLEKRFRKPLGIDRYPRPASHQECSDAIERGIQGIEKNNLSVRELKDQANVVSNWIEEHKSSFSQETKDSLKKHWDTVHNAFLGDKQLQWLKWQHDKSRSQQSQEFKEAVADYLHSAREHIEAIWKERQDKFKDINTRLAEAANFIFRHQKEFHEIGYNFEQFREMQLEAITFKNNIWKCYRMKKEVDHVNRFLFENYGKAVLKMYKDLKNFLEIDHKLEPKRVLDRKERIEKLLRELPEVRPTVSDLPRKQWWKLYIDAPMYKDAQKLSDPGRFFDQDASPGYQKSMLNLFDKVLVPAQNRSKNGMNYIHYTEIHNIATKYASNDNKNEMRINGGIADNGKFYTLYTIKPMEKLEVQERLETLKEMREERINDLPLFQNWRSGEDFLGQIVRKIAQSPPQAITVGWVRHDYRQTQEHGNKFYGARPGYTIMIPAYLDKEVPRHVNAILESYYQGREEQNQTEYQRPREIAKTVRSLHIMHPKSDGNGRANIFGLMNKWLIEEGFSPAILPNGPGVFGGTKTLDGLVEDMLNGMHSFIKEVEANRNKKNKLARKSQ